MTETTPSGVSRPHSHMVDSPGRQPRFTRNLSWTRVDLCAVLLLCLAAVLVLYWFWQPGVSGEADMLMGVYRVFELDQAVRHWILFPRLGPDLNFTYGAPLFQFYPPLVSYGALVFHWAGLGFIEAAKAMFSASLVLAGLGAYTYSRWLFDDRRAALASGIAYMFAPYLLTVIYERGAGAEALALGLLPWVFWVLHRTLDERSRGWIAGGAVLVALLMLSHNITTLFVLPVVAVYLLVLAWHEDRLMQMGAVLAALLLGLGLSAFYWMPALGELKSSRADANMLGGGTSVLSNLVPLNMLIQPSLVFDYWGPMRFHLALWQAVFGALSTLAVVVQPPRLRFNVALLAGIALLGLILQLTLSAILWQALPLVRFIQFPWRLLGLVSFCISMVFGSVFCWKPLKGAVGAVLMIGLLVFIVFSGTQRLDPGLSPIWYPITESEIGKLDLFERGRFEYPLFGDYTPQAMRVTSGALANSRPADVAVAAPLGTVPRILVLSEKFDHLELDVGAESPFTLYVHRVYFPGWQIYVSGREIPTGPGGYVGLVSAEIPAGNHRVTVRFEDTPLRRVATLISLVSAVLLILLIANLKRARAVILVVGVLALTSLTLFVSHQGIRQPAFRPVAHTANFQDEIHLLGYHLPKTTWKPGDILPLRLYWLAQQTPKDDYKVFIHLAPLDDTGPVAQSDRLPLLNTNPPTLWEPGELVVDEQQLELPEDTPAGAYRLLMGLYRPSDVRNLTVSQALNVLPGDRVVLTEIEVGDD